MKPLSCTIVWVLLAAQHVRGFALCPKDLHFWPPRLMPVQMSRERNHHGLGRHNGVAARRGDYVSHALHFLSMRSTCIQRPTEIQVNAWIKNVGACNDPCICLCNLSHFPATNGHMNFAVAADQASNHFARVTVAPGKYTQMAYLKPHWHQN